MRSHEALAWTYSVAQPALNEVVPAIGGQIGNSRVLDIGESLAIAIRTAASIDLVSKHRILCAVIALPHLKKVHPEAYLDGPTALTGPTRAAGTVPVRSFDQHERIY